MDSEDQSTSAAKSRVSIACLPCRNRHVRCDAQQPVCVRCSSDGRKCEYVKSRRGGLSRARLAECRRARSNRNGAAVITGSPSEETSPESRSPGGGMGHEEQHQHQHQHQSSSGEFPPLAFPPGCSSSRSAESETSGREEDTYGTPNSITDVQFSSVAGDFLVKAYYKHFHKCHPCVLPQHNLQQYHESAPGQQGSLALLIAVMRYIGSLYSCPELTPQLQEKVVEGLQAAKQLAPDPFLVQFHLLYSIALYWSAEKIRARDEIDTAIQLALNLGMNRRRFAGEHGRGDAVLQESFRRVWWQLYCIDAYYAAIKRLPTFPLCEVDSDTELPCEEDEYELGSIPTPKSLEDFDTREFGPENQSFSSFAYLIGATRSIALVLSAGAPDASNWLSPRTIAEVDAIIDGWFLLLPKSKREVLKENNVVDELMFQAQMAVHANLIALHRPFSRLPVNPLEGISSCLAEPPRRLPVKDSETAHTQRCLQSIEAQLQLLVLPVQPLFRSPFTICMTAASTHALLAAIKALFSGRQLAVARHQLRLVVGYIKTLAKVWRQGGRNLEEIQSIAKEVLSRKNEFTHTQHLQRRPERESAQELLPPPAGGIGNEHEQGGGGGVEGLDGGCWSINPPALPIQGGTPDYSLSAFWNMTTNDLQQPDIPVWFSSY
ncbi:hypothetical protein F5Y14DRAFT_400056 [Nemania sp. NC0429]|nr:hypothetical protein F5Y14DRAFT_400056 [Nemania sp. NC0429]